jgi:hypothetical protein
MKSGIQVRKNVVASRSLKVYNEGCRLFFNLLSRTGYIPAAASYFEGKAERPVYA